MCDQSSANIKSLFQWSKEMNCGGGLGHGSCSTVDGSSIPTCICADGYVHDLSFVRYRNCSLPKLLLPIWFGIQISPSLMLLPFIASKYKDVKSYARLSVSASNFIEVYSLISPLLAVIGKSSKPIKKLIFRLHVFFRVIELIPFLIAAILYDDFNDEKNDQGWSNMTQLYCLLVAIETFLLFAYLVVAGSKLVQLIEKISRNKSDSNERKQNDNTKEYVGKVKTLISRVQFIMPTVTLLLCIPPILQFTYRIMPYNFVFDTMALSSVPLFAYTNAKFASNASKRFADNPSDKNQLQSNKKGSMDAGFTEVTRTGNGDVMPFAVHPAGEPTSVTY